MARPHLLKATLWGAAIVAGGYVTMLIATPSDEKFYNSLSPDLKRRVDEQRNATKRQDEFAMLKASAEAGEPVFQDAKRR